ncbi:hypothetical protein GCM10022381_42080 [Leifsonia kafniensis]|uniref:Periplasmic copper-binding protein NosD beta helix domain-containing protein n=1 Tax=Leifsonia kafniensis TaxID=475957 RepID=A0ABP7LAY2_9MICO
MFRRVLAAIAVAALTIVFAACARVDETSTPDGQRQVIHVPGDAQTLAKAAKLVRAGGVISIAPGTYDEQLLIDTPDVTVRGESRSETIINGGGVRPYGVVAVADGVRVENLTVTGATFYGVLFTGLHDENGPSAPTADGYEHWDPEQFPPLERFLVDHVTAYNNGLYGIYAFNSRHGIIRDSYASGSADSGIYVGQCTACDILVTGNVAERNAAGFENSNASDSVVITGNRFSGNRIGMTLLSSYQEAFTPQRSNQVIGNLVTDNNEPLAPAQANGAFATGIGVSGGQDNVFERNLIAGHERAGIIFTNTEDLPASGNHVSGNVFDANGVDVANTSAARTPATANCVADAASTVPAELFAQLSAACAGDAAAAAAAQAYTAELNTPPAPRGTSFKKVAPPRAQSDLPAGSSYPALPATVAMPDLAQFGVPDASFLVERAGTR